MELYLLGLVWGRNIQAKWKIKRLTLGSYSVSKAGGTMSTLNYICNTMFIATDRMSDD